MKPAIPTRTIRRRSPAASRFTADTCVVGSDAAGISAALEAVRAGSGSVHQIERAALKSAIADNLERCDPCRAEGRA